MSKRRGRMKAGFYRRETGYALRQTGCAKQHNNVQENQTIFFLPATSTLIFSGCQFSHLSQHKRQSSAYHVRRSICCTKGCITLRSVLMA